jgi:hypothetical protein
LVVLDLVDRVILPQAAEDERLEVSGHHIQRVCHLAINRRRCVVQIVVQKATNYGL